MNKKQKDVIYQKLIDGLPRSLMKSNFIAKLVCKVMKEMNIPTLKKQGNCVYRKTKEWNEAIELAKELFNRIVDNESGCFLEEEFK